MQWLSPWVSDAGGSSCNLWESLGISGSLGELLGVAHVVARMHTYMYTYIHIHTYFTQGT